MSEQDENPDQYIELRSIYKYYIDSYNALYQLKTEKDEDLSSIYNQLKTELIETRKYSPVKIVRDVLSIIPYNNRYAKSYLSLAKLISDDYHVKEVNNVEPISNFLFYKEYGIKIDKAYDFKEFKSENLEIHKEDTIYKVIMNNDIKRFILFTESDEFDRFQVLKSKLYPDSKKGYSLLELCCYHGAVDCFKLLRTEFNSEITQKCLRLSFLGGNPEIMSECLKHHKPKEKCMKYAIISHNIDFVTFLMNEYKMRIDSYYCGMYNNLESFFVDFDQKNNFRKCFVYSTMFDLPYLCEYFLSLGADINDKDEDGRTSLHIAAYYDFKEIAELLISHGANIDEKDNDEKLPIHYAAYFNSKETAELLISHSAIINGKDKYGETTIHKVAYFNSKETAEFLILHGANIDEKNEEGNTVLHIAAFHNNKETAEVLILHGADIDAIDEDGRTALHIAAFHNCKETAEFLISHGADIYAIDDKFGDAPLHLAAHKNSKEIVENLILHGANINEKNKLGNTALQKAAMYNSLEADEILILRGANINGKNKNGRTALHYAAIHNCKETAEFLISHGAAINVKDKSGKTLLQAARCEHSNETAELLIANGEK
ncbi:ankyrin repeat protein, putative [Trichomonas vaginalis G3]|uniref:Ankyrin repeat protein, putative n=1 Tax=Trichomonas vaginalis (strain ATCC PRA-98 / G3) TaxID=412133 RepID=A2ECP1_TRIV3|nr:ankyrin repeat and SOCS box-containing protein 4 family [Trichomonas vaginalis G3]EAY09537.1 ankyrin repeat protein, putative [Trichomonas vaginalis G3]KAI5533163.1 ankyrin repeat and SOCS box-containing protein 4 family [Trichomonas vaginalis G3]|eukprot:XP_001321760.1 ankyrin repeat protein [Trichomonas vaginalis G3]